MKFITSFLSVIIFATTGLSQQPNKSDGQKLLPSPGDTITVGYPAPSFSFPSAAKIVSGRFRSGPNNTTWEDEPGCTASLIYPNIILTAQHCLVSLDGKMKKQISVRFRETQTSPVQTFKINLSKSNTFLKSEALGVNINGRRQWVSENDIALVRLQSNVDDWQRRVVRIASTNDLQIYDSAIFAGWGLQLPGVSKNRRQLAYLNDLSPVNGTTYSSKVMYFQRPATYRGSLVAAGVCNGDSGGPVYLSKNGRIDEELLLVGVIQAVSPSGGTATMCAAANSVSIAIGLLANENFLKAGMNYFARQ